MRSFQSSSSCRGGHVQAPPSPFAVAVDPRAARRGVAPTMPSSSSTTAAAAETTTGVVDDGDVLGRCCLEMEEALNYSYREGRVATGSIGVLEIRVVRPGTFEEVADHAVVSRGASVGQYKVPRCVTVPAVVELLDSRVVSRHFSSALPHWESGLRLEEETTAL